MLIVEIGMEMDELHQELLDLLIQGNYNNFISFFVANQALISTEHVFEDGNSLFLHACYDRPIEIVKFLVENGADINFGNMDGLTPVGLASFNHREDLVHYLVMCGANLESFDIVYHPLLLAAKNGNLPILSYLVANGANFTFDENSATTLLHEAVFGGNPEMIRFALQLGIDVNASIEFHFSPLSCAIHTLSFENVLILLSAGANPDATDQFGFTCLMEAVKVGREDIVRSLLNHGANIELLNAEGKSVLDVAKRYSWPLIDEILKPYRERFA